METVERVEDLKKIDVFTDTCPVTFEGFEYNDETNEYVIELGPL